MKMKEETIQKHLVQYIRMQYPKVVLITNPQSSINMTVGQAVKAKALGFVSGQPDLILIQQRFKTRHVKDSQGSYDCYYSYSGLAIELKTKKDKKDIRYRREKGKKKDQMLWTSDHIENQFNYLMKLRKADIKVSFAIGFDKAKSIIDKYMGG